MLGQKKEYTLIKSYCKFDLTGKYVYQRSTIVDIWQTILQRIKTKKLTCKDIEILDEDIQKKEDFNKFHAWVVDWFNNTPEEIERFLEDIQLDRRNNGEYAYTLTTKFDGERMYEIYKEKQKELVKEAIKHGNPDLIKGEQKMGKIVTLDQAYESIINNSLQCSYYNMFKEASDRGDCQLMQSDGSSSIEILYKMDEDLGENVIGLVIFPFGSDITVYTAIEDKYGLRAKLQVVEGLSETATLPEILTTAQAKLNICPVCGKEVPYKEQHQYGFAGRCCVDCLPSMQQEHEQPGWYN